jgi:hypothetical protein
MSQAHALINLFILMGPLVLALVVGLVVMNSGLHPFGTATLSIAMYSVGFALFVAAKVSVMRRGHLISFGSGLMSLWSRRLYRLGYTLMIGGAVLTFGLVVTAKVVAGGSPANKARGRAGTGAAASSRDVRDTGRSAP